MICGASACVRNGGFCSLLFAVHVCIGIKTEHALFLEQNKIEDCMNVQDVWVLAEETQGRIAAEIRTLLGEEQLDQSLFTQDQKDRRIKAMKKCARESESDSERHEAWMKMHIDYGWVYGEVYNPMLKTHPNLLAWSDLPSTVKAKANIFNIIAASALKMERLMMSCEDCEESE